VNVLGRQPFKYPFQGVLLVETDIGVAIPVLNADYHVIDDRNPGTIPRKLLVCRFRVVLFRLDELVVEVQDIGFTSPQTACRQQGFEQQVVQQVSRVEFIYLP